MSGSRTPCRACENNHKAAGAASRQCRSPRGFSRGPWPRTQKLPSALDWYAPAPRSAYVRAMATGVKELKLWQEAVALAGEVVRVARTAARRETKAFTD